MAIWKFPQGSLEVFEGDLTRSTADAIVNAANSGLLGGGGVDGAIHRAAGPELLSACRDVVAQIGSLPPGLAVITPGFRLSARHVIHTVGPVWRGGSQGEERLLRSAYAQSLDLASRHGLTSIAFPAISCGAYGYPLELAAPIALDELRAGLAQGLVRCAALCLRGERAFTFWRGRAEALFGPPQVP
ncbi:MAG: O-acetyl-ADP-ribose deacetylase [Desulfovibrio sp.]|jgi:O-acetyl-ADP-ribose deacetylase (regulator of RNase III)|nr:O-acetyl-ADP-ribose deacetylase [Desulfovibrio sp.]